MQHVRHDLRHSRRTNVKSSVLAAAFRNAECNHFGFCIVSLRLFDMLARVLVPFLAADVSPIDFYWATKHLCTVIVSCVPDVLERVPRRLLCHIDILGQLNAGNSLVMARIQPNGRKKFRQYLMKLSANIASVIRQNVRRHSI